MLNTHLVKWSELEETFHKLFPVTISDVLNSEYAMIAMVRYAGQIFEIRPVRAPHFGTTRCGFSVVGIEIWGPAHINQFPNPIFTTTITQ